MVCPMHRLTRHLARRVVALPVAIACAFILAQPAVGAPTPGTRLWATHDTVSFENSTGIVASPDGSKVFVTGNKGPRAYNASTGAKIWSTLRGFNNYSYIAASPDGSMVFVTGWTATVAYDAATGRLLWVKDVRPSGFWWAVASGGTGADVFVAGSSGGGNGNLTVVAYDARTGVKRWVQRFQSRQGASDGQS